MGKRLKIPKELPEAVIPRRTDNTMVKRLKIPVLLGMTASGNSFGIFKRLTIILSVLLGITASGNSFGIFKRLTIVLSVPEAVIPRRTGQQKKYKKCNFWVMVFIAIFNNISVIS
jgi:predicted ABC-type exoprotein transport system permease subunit